MDIDLNALEQAALSATPGPWRVQHPNAGSRGFEVADDTGLEQICADVTEERAAFISSANPAVVLDLVRRLRAAERCVAEQEQRKRLLDGRKSNVEEYRMAISVMHEAGGRASASLVQRKLSIPFMDACALVEQAVREGFVNKPDHWSDNWDDARFSAPATLPHPMGSMGEEV